MKNFGLFVLGIMLGALAMYFYFNQNQDMITEPKKPSGLITPEEIRTLDQAYNERYKIINDSLFKNSKAEDNRSSWYKLDEIENYLAYAKHQAKEKGYTLNGLRLYLGAYPDTNEGKGLTTLFFVPTGYENKSDGNFLSLAGDDDGDDIPGGGGLNIGGTGHPPSANYPQ
ncbi:hypothetical protein [Winogradskyella bathintestinalis]|uniref:Uncharacterized protein n=1 Tax=Winogradskyella bathintestinalis TaxID=3035208 RepID=A0ABT7ZVX1_9FLAO|nr:hypothetical protein [Winogradskyella bathintestinalis]MDN3492984.1 hypothetical protein [Winogradskyella bathintestinalis]